MSDPVVRGPWSAKVVFISFLSVLCVLCVAPAVSVAGEVPAASIQSLSRASRLHNLLISRKILVDTVLTWEGIEYDVSKTYVICDSYEGICIKGYQAGFNEPIMLAVSENLGGDLQIQVVDWGKYRQDRSAEAIAFYKKTRGLSEAEVFLLKDAQGLDLFDIRGNLTKQGENSYASELEGRSIGGATKAPPLKIKGAKKGTKVGNADKDLAAGKGRGKADTGFSKLTVKEILYMGYKEVFAREMDCIHSIDINDSDIAMEKVNDKGRVRWFITPKDPTYNIAMRFRKKKVCKPFGE